MLDAELCTTCPGERVLVLSSDVLESLLPSQSHTPFESKSSTFFFESSQSRVMAWSSGVTRNVESLRHIGLQARVNVDSHKVSQFFYAVMWSRP